ncbi:hypothetical protein [Acinetobacter sp. MD2(2019)]|uniref:hypothetical protein n=1 Tax=Acinetobacter sp. MD2(2019) TaxID=2605273 RepID=UPI002D1EFD9B|nr:hypothetical protein [Acinetobacter sp. MD2(2019)]MEB3754302.1 hypothetical protein [Acinetobacter sp. MD2(2019)]
MRLNETTLVKSLYCQINSNESTQAVNIAKKTFGEQSAVTKLLANKSFSNPSQQDWNNITASQQFINLIESISLVGQLKALNKHIELPLDTMLSSFDLMDCQVVLQSEPTAVLNESSKIGFKLESKKIGGFAIFPDRYFNSDLFDKIEPMINQALANSYAAGENTDLINTLKTDAVEVANLDTALQGIKEIKNAVIAMNPADAMQLAKSINSDKLGVNGGVYFDIPAITNKSILEGEKLIFDLSKLVLAQDPSIVIQQAAESFVVDMTGQPVYLFQENKKAIKIVGYTGYEFMTGYKATLVKG